MFKAKKECVLIVLIFLLIMPLVFADETIDKVYSCLELKLNSTATKCSSLDFESQIHSLIAASYNSEFKAQCRAPIIAAKDPQNCWPKGNCNLKDTSLAVIALNRLRENTTASEEWLLSKKIKAGNLDWYLEIDATSQSNCDILAKGETSSVVQAENKKLSGTLSSCLKFDYNNYWLKIDSNCLDETFRISCDKDFLTTLLYKNPSDSQTWFVTSNPQSSAAKGTTEHSINFFCFSTSGTCDYEGSLWASLALKEAKNPEKTSEFLPYLKAFAEDNKQFFPYAFLYRLGETDFLEDINNLKDLTYFWGSKISTNEKTWQYYTALGILALQDSASQTKNELIKTSKDKPVKDACWGNIRDTAFLLWAGWPREPLGPPVPCSDVSGFCTTSSQCTETKGTILNGECSSGVCCSDKQLSLRQCSEIGKICGDSQSCNSTYVSTNDTSKCCTSECLDISGCIENSFYCLNSGLECTLASGNEKTSYFCADSKSCCDNNYEATQNCTDIEYAGTKGIFCKPGEGCNGEKVDSLDGEKVDSLDGSCCVGTCEKKPCLELEGRICENNQVCSGTQVESTDSSKCCLEGDCIIETELSDCEDYDYFCLNQGECDEAGGNTLENFVCGNSRKICCDEQAITIEKTCEELGGRECGSGQACSGSILTASDTSDCCSNNYNCEDVSSQEPFVTPSGKSYWWVYVLVILIILIVIAIIFRDRLKMFIFNLRKGKGSQSSIRRPPYMPPALGRPQIPIRRPMPSSARPSSRTDKELDDTLKKLREMSK